MANTPTTTSTNTTSDTTEEFGRKDVARIFARLRHEVNGLVDDSHRRTPFYAKSKDEAVAKRNAAVKVLDEFADRIDTLKKENN